MRLKHWMFRVMPLVALAPLALPAAEADQTRWNLGDFSWVKRVPAEPGAAPNTQPAHLSAEAIQALLVPVQATVEGKAVPLFTRNELKDLTNALSEALALAQPGEDLILVSSARRGSLYQRAEGLTARLFLQGGALNLIVHDARVAFMDRWLEETILPTFVYGSRQTASAALLQAPGAKRLRPDWLALPLAPATASAAAPAVAPAAAPAAAPAPVAAPVPATAPALAAREEEAYQAKAQRLRTLKRLREENLISEAEYQAQREALLKAL